MSGLLRRIKRSRAADAGEAPAEGQAAGPEGTRTTAEPSAAADERSPGTPEPGAGMLATGTTAPAIQADPNTPAGLDPAAVGAAPATGRRSRLRRRLRYLRRARELMLRDLGGMLYEVHRTGAGDAAAHSGVIGAKVERLSSLDAEATAIETALGAPRSEAVVFQPGVGGTCVFCGELYGSAARFCSHCGSPTGSAPRPEPRAAPAMPPRTEPSARATDAVGGPAEQHRDEAQTEAVGAPGADEARNLSNGRPDARTPPELSPDDPLAARESRP